MVRIPGGTFLMGSAAFYPEERPVHAASVGAFWMDRRPVTVAAFRRFARATGYVTLAERAPDPADYPQAVAENLVPGALVFTMPQQPVALDDWRQWWAYVPGADWWHPLGPQDTMFGREMHPVTQVAFQDAVAYAVWAGKSLPTEAEWEFAARGGLEGAVFSWSDEFEPRHVRMANTWHGEFPWHYVADVGGAELPGTTPVCMY
ncbi:MAG: SUMF1/EgtB/PvdO family nonheme iron enzyme, partial [Actinocrinis sp.]